MNSESIVSFEQQGPFTIGTVGADRVLDATSIDEFGKAVIARVQSNPGLKLVLDYEQVEYLSSAVLSELIRINRAINETGGALRLCTLNPSIRKVFEITNLDRVFTIDKDLATSLKRFPRAMAVKEEETAWDDGQKR